MKINWKLLPLTLLSLPTLSWAVGPCFGEWTSDVPNVWQDSANWATSGVCGTDYPGQSGTSNSIAECGLFGAQKEITLLPTAINPVILNQFFLNTSYTFNPDPMGSTIRIVSNPPNIPGLIHVIGGTHTFNTFVSMESIFAPVTIVMKSGSIIFKNDTGGAIGSDNIILLRDGTGNDPIALYTSKLFNAVQGLFINPLVTDNAQFININNNGTGAIVQVATNLLIGASDPNHFGYSNINNETWTPTSQGARTVIGDSIIFQTTEGRQGQLRIVNNGEVSGAAYGSFIFTSNVEGSGLIEMSNQGTITNEAMGAFFLVSAFTGSDPKQWNWSATNNGSISGNFSKGVFIDLSGQPLNMGENSQMILSNKGSVLNGAVGTHFSCEGYFQSGGLVTIAKGGTVDPSSIGSLLTVYGPMTITKGTLINDDLVLFATDLLVTGEGSIQGTGTFASTTSSFPTLNPFNQFINNGTVRPGHSPGRMRLVGHYKQTPNGTLEIHILNASGPGEKGYSQLSISETAALDGTLKIIFDPGASVNCHDQFTVVETTGGVSGKFSSVNIVNLPCQLEPTLSYLPNSVLFQLNPCCVSSIVNFTQTLFASITDTNNFFIKRQLQRIQQSVVSKEENKQMGNFYIGPTGSVGKSDRTDSQLGFNYWSAGAVTGADYALSEGGVGGLVLYENIRSSRIDNKQAHFRVQRAHATLYGTYLPLQAPELSLDLMVGGGYDWYQTGKNSSPTGYELDSMLSLEYTFTQNSYHIIPMANLQYTYLHFNNHQNLAFDNNHRESLTTILGLWGDRTWNKEHPFTAQANLGWQHEYLNNSQSNSERNSLLAGIDLLFQWKSNSSVEFSYDLIWNNQFNRNGFYIGYNTSF